MTLSQNFIAALTPRRHHLYALASAAAPANPESQLLTAIHNTFPQFAKDPALNPAQAMEKFLTPAAPAPIENQIMPADIWARLVAAVQIEAARSEHSTALNPDSVLINPDPLLAPKKSLRPDDAEGFDLHPASRFLLAGTIALLIAIGITIYLLTRPVPPSNPASRPATNSTTSP